MKKLYVDNNHVIALTEKDNIFIIWCRIGNPVKVSTQFTSLESVCKLVKTPMGVYENTHQHHLVFLNRIEKRVEKVLNQHLDSMQKITVKEKGKIEYEKTPEQITYEVMQMLKTEMFKKLRN